MEFQCGQCGFKWKTVPSRQKYFTDGPRKCPYCGSKKWREEVHEMVRERIEEIRAQEEKSP